MFAQKHAAGGITNIVLVYVPLHFQQADRVVSMVTWYLPHSLFSGVITTWSFFHQSIDGAFKIYLVSMNLLS